MEHQLEQIKEQQKNSWNRFSGGWKTWDSFTMSFLRPMGESMIRHLNIQPTDIVLDIATGTGEPGLTIAAMANKGKVIGTDLSDKMLATAASNAERLGRHNYTTHAADVCELPFDAQFFDKVSCRMGFMYFPDMQLAANEMFRVLKPGGRVATAVWAAPEHNFWVTAIMGVVNKHIPTPPAPGGPGMFRCAKPGLMAEIFTKAGFANAGEEVLGGKADYIDADNYWRHMLDVAAPVVGAMEKSDEATKTAIKNEVYELINRRSAPMGRRCLNLKPG